MLFIYTVAFALPGKMVTLDNDSSKVHVKSLQITLKVNEKVHNFQQKEENMLIKRIQQSKVQLEGEKKHTDKTNKDLVR